jgi:hypothetical protein
MAHRTSAAALRTARMILQQYELTVRPPETLVSGRLDKLTNSEAHVAIVIDYATNIFQLVSLRPEIIYWQTRLRLGSATAPQVAGLLKKLLDAFDALPKDGISDEPVTSTFAPPPQYEKLKQIVVRISKPSKEVSRFIFHYYIPKPKSESFACDEMIHRLKIAHLAEASLGLRRAYAFFPKIKEELKRLVDGHATEVEVKACMRDVGIVLEYIPTYEDRREEGKILI